MAFHQNLIIPTPFIKEEPLVIWSKGFTEEEVEMVVNQCELEEFVRGEIDATDEQLEYRNSNICWLNPDNESNNWIYERVTGLMSRINHDKFQYVLDNIQVIQYTKYQEGQFYNWHTDSGSDGEYRKLSMVISLSEPSDYEGGDFEFSPTGNPERAQSIRLNKGDVAVFSSVLPHRVTEVTKNTRLTLVAWAVGPKFK